MVPTGAGKREGIFQSGNFAKIGQVREFYSKYWKNREFNQQSWGNENVYRYMSTNIFKPRYASNTVLGK